MGTRFARLLRCTPGSRGDAGVTLVEISIGMAIFSVIFAAVLATLDSTTKNQAGTQAKAEKLDELRGAVDRIGKEARQALTIDPASTRSRLSMRTLINSDEWDVVYEIADGTLTRKSKPVADPPVEFGQPTLLADSITNGSSVFCYEQLTGSTCPAAVPGSAPETITIQLVAHPRAPAAGELTLKVEIRRRNLNPS